MSIFIKSNNQLDRRPVCKTGNLEIIIFFK